MLSRIAESLFWMGRYLERADDTSRILDVEVHQFLEDPTRDEHSVAQSLISALGVGSLDQEDIDLDDVVSLLSFNLELPSSILSSITFARENARGIRESISSELWEALNVTYNTVLARSMSQGSMGPHEFFRFARLIKERVALASGIADTTMSRDDSWCFLTLGRTIERVDMTVRLLGVRHVAQGSPSDLIATLRSCSAHEAYLRSYGGEIDGIKVIEFLLLDRWFPRSVHFALSAAEGALRDLSPSLGRIGTTEEAQRVLGRAKATLDYRDISDIYENLPEVLLIIEGACSDTSSAISRRFFRESKREHWLHEDPIGRGAR